MLCSVHINPPDVYNDIRIAALLRNFRNSQCLFPCSVIMIYELLRCCAISAILNVCFSVVYIMIYELLRCFATFAILPTFGIREFFFQKNCYFLMWGRNTKTLVFFCKQKKLYFVFLLYHYSSICCICNRKMQYMVLQFKM